MRRNLFTIFLMIIVSLLVACGSNTKKIVTEKESTNIKGLVNDFNTDKFKDQTAAITSNELIIMSSDESQDVYDISKEDFFVSIAPYINETHPWLFHNLTGCQGEMTNQEFEVYIEDKKGNVIIDEIITSQSNGFINLWLPRDNIYRVIIKQGEKSVESMLSTFESDGTCITDMQLSNNKNDIVVF
ncbi:CueP family metal-binding protein [Niallia oryzisoli]|uniref:CueP family metal-binding protein n=1 Tax=Niallia oryzisoli TaxID=1737571 RepID=UPI00373652FD